MKDRHVTDDSIGELPNRPQPFYNGTNPGVRLDAVPCGVPEDFRGEGTVPRLPSGRLDFARWCDCAYRPCIGFEAVSKFTKKFRAKIAWEGTSTEYDPGDSRYVTDLALTGETTDLPQTGGWYFSVRGGASYSHPEEDHFCFHAEDSYLCGGENGDRQTGHARKHFEMPTGGTLRFQLAGRVERENAGYDTLRIVIDGDELFYDGGIEAGEGCAMQDVSGDVEAVLSPGVHQVDVYFDTVDGNYHVDCFWCVEVTTTEGAAGDVAVEGEFTEHEPAFESFAADLYAEGLFAELDPAADRFTGDHQAAGVFGEGEPAEGSFTGDHQAAGEFDEGDSPEGSFDGDHQAAGEFTEF